MSELYRVEVKQAQVIEVIVIADTPEEATERALQGEGKPGESWQEEPKVASIVKLEG
tara:strand:- start:2 stop:172 length:171 start_codon:yes stop_codon:yes gene_type:complete